MTIVQTLFLTNVFVFLYFGIIIQVVGKFSFALKTVCYILAASNLVLLLRVLGFIVYNANGVT